MQDWQRVAHIDELEKAGRLLRKVAAFEVLLIARPAPIGVVALQNYCPHLGKPLDKGRIRDGQLTCPFHGACFDIDTGLPIAGPSKTAVHRFPSRVLESGDIEVDASAKPSGIRGAWPLK